MPRNESGTDSIPLIDKKQLWGWWKDREDVKERLYMKAAHKALDIPDDDMQINANKSGIGALGAIGIALAAGIAPSILGLFILLRDRPVQPEAPKTPPPIEKIIDKTKDVDLGIDVDYVPPAKTQ